MIHRLCLLAALTLAAPAWAQVSTSSPGTAGIIVSGGNYSVCTEQFKDVPALAERLGVPEGMGKGSFVFGLCDGRKYDFFALINAFLDKMEAAK